MEHKAQRELRAQFSQLNVTCMAEIDLEKITLLLIEGRDSVFEYMAEVKCAFLLNEYLS
jgi:hypothetical protein